MESPEERMVYTLKEMLVEARDATKRANPKLSDEKIWGLYVAQDGDTQFRTFRKWFSFEEGSIPDLRQYRILRNVLNNRQNEVTLPTLFDDDEASMRYFKPTPSDLPFSLSVVPSPRQEDLISALG